STRAISASDPTAGLAFRALENFQYRMLTSDIRYQPSGDARLALGFEGKNPDFFDGQTTRLNVNLDYNLLDLLESLRLTDQLIENVEAKYR
ncbi:MAG: intermembrane phospholipid transport protein YdbH family protein, partial [Oceanobacter sp.]